MDQTIIKKWTEATLADKGYKGISDFVVVRDMPWSCVYSIITDQGKLYIKWMADAFLIEPKILAFLRDKNIAQNVIDIISIKEDGLVFIMKDRGSPLRDQLKKAYDIALPQQALKDYAAIQVKASDYVDDLINAGVNDWRLMRVPQLFKEFMADEKFLITRGLKKSDIERLNGLFEAVQSLCDALSKYKIPQTLEHGDFQDNNVLIDIDHSLTINDWGDTSISHPFISCAGFLTSACHSHNFDKDSERFKALRDTYLKCWAAFETEENLLKIFELASILRDFTFSMNFKKIFSCPEIAKLTKYDDYIKNDLLAFADKLEKIKTHL